MALFNYTACEDEELSFKEGDVLQVDVKPNKGWSYAIHSNGRKGYIPMNFVERQTDLTVSNVIIMISVVHTLFVYHV